mgnify:FL=1
MKRIFKLGMMAVVLSLCFSGCVIKAGRKPSETEESSKSDKKSDTEFSKGDYIGETYINKDRKSVV